MVHSLVTIIAPLELERVPDAEAAIDLLGNPALPEIAEALGRLEGEAGTHFASLHAFRSQDGQRAYIAFEFSADGAEDAALDRIIVAIGDRLRPVFMFAKDWSDGANLHDYLRDHRVKVGTGWFFHPGLVFAGTPGLSVGRIRREAHLAARAAGLLADQSGDLDGLQRIEAVRAAVASDPQLAGALGPAEIDAPYEPVSGIVFAGQLLASFAQAYLWPIGIVLLGWAVYAGIRGVQHHHGAALRVPIFLGSALVGLWNGFWVAFLLLLIVAIVFVVLFRAAEARDSLEERVADRATLAAMFERENHVAQNHMISVTQRKPGFIRKITSRLIFWVIGESAGKIYAPGLLSDIGTIHFARWVTAPKSPDLIFFSNYGGSWESYLEDFITRAHRGLTGVWSNSIGFPRAEYLVLKGATDGERFKRYARHSMVPTRFWYSAYPTLTTAVIRNNAEIRRGLSGTMTEDEAARWLALFGSAARPPSKLVSSEIQSLIFGGLSFMPHGTCLLYQLPEGEAAARDWLRQVLPHVAFDDGRRLGADAVLTLALGAGGLARLGLPAESLDTFPFAFVDGMTSSSRARLLGDLGDNSADRWRWGRRQPDAALLVYGRSAEAVAALEETLAGLAAAHGMSAPYAVPLAPVTRDKREPFGFVDGISQPVIRGTYKSLRNADPIHLVEPGEFILGYPDNRGNMPPGPTLPAILDPSNRLPLVGERDDFARTVVENIRDVGHNGSFLVIRELEQDVGGFDAYCAAEATRLAERLPPPYDMTPDFIAAKLVGRWKDGSSLARHPYQPVSSPAAEPESETSRPQTNPPAAMPVERPPPRRTHDDNDFLFGTEDPEALRCPFGAHIRRANPRDSLDPGSADQIAISNRHRILRVGRQYQPGPGQKPGLLFMCLNGDIERQFEFIQQTWLKSPSFHGLSCEKDPLLGDGETGACGFTVPSRDGPVRLSPMPPFIATRGGGYFFVPGKRLLDYLSLPA